MTFLWVFLQLLCIVSLYRAAIRQYTRTESNHASTVWNKWKNRHGHTIRPVRHWLHFCDTLVELYTQISALNHSLQNALRTFVWGTREAHGALQNSHITLVILCNGDVHATRQDLWMTTDRPYVFATDDLIARGHSAAKLYHLTSGAKNCWLWYFHRRSRSRPTLCGLSFSA